MHARGDAQADAATCAIESARMRPLAAPAFDAAAPHLLTLPNRLLIAVEGATYSAPREWAWHDVTVRVGTGTGCTGCRIIV